MTRGSPAFRRERDWPEVLGQICVGERACGADGRRTSVAWRSQPSSAKIISQRCGDRAGTLRLGVASGSRNGV